MGASDVQIWNQTHIEAVKANKNLLRNAPNFGCEAYFILDDCIEKGTVRYHLILLAQK